MTALWQLHSGCPGPYCAKPMHPVCFAHHPWFAPSLLGQVSRNRAFQWPSLEERDFVQGQWLWPIFVTKAVSYFVVLCEKGQFWALYFCVWFLKDKRLIVYQWLFLFLLNTLLGLFVAIFLDHPTSVVTQASGRWSAGCRWRQPPKSTHLWVDANVTPWLFWLSVFVAGVNIYPRENQLLLCWQLLQTVTSH